MFYGVLADSVVVLHFLWIAFLVFGAIWGKKNHMVRMVHVPGLIFACFLEIFGWYCPLTYLESWLRAKQGPSHVYAGSCIAHYLEKVVYIQISRGALVLLTMLVLLFNAWIYLRGRKN